MWTGSCRSEGCSPPDCRLGSSSRSCRASTRRKPSTFRRHTRDDRPSRARPHDRAHPVPARQQGRHIRLPRHRASRPMTGCANGSVTRPDDEPADRCDTAASAQGAVSFAVAALGRFCWALVLDRDDDLADLAHASRLGPAIPGGLLRAPVFMIRASPLRSRRSSGSSPEAAGSRLHACRTVRATWSYGWWVRAGS
jgi:hypothetical protein